MIIVSKKVESIIQDACTEEGVFPRICLSGMT